MSNSDAFIDNMKYIANDSQEESEHIQTISHPDENHLTEGLPQQEIPVQKKCQSTKKCPGGRKAFAKARSSAKVKASSRPKTKKRPRSTSAGKSAKTPRKANIVVDSSSSSVEDSVEYEDAPVSRREWATMNDKMDWVVELVGRLAEGSASSSQRPLPAETEDNQAFPPPWHPLANSFLLPPRNHLNRQEGQCPRGAISAGHEVGYNVPHALKLKIWTHKYVDFHELLHPEPDKRYTLTFDDKDDIPSLDLTKKLKPLSDIDWEDAFLILFAIYTSKHMQDQPDLLLYLKHVRHLRKLGKNWLYYDEEFRRERETDMYSWSLFRIDLHVDCDVATPRQVFSSQAGTSKRTAGFITPGREKFRQGAKNTVPFGYCFNYHATSVRCTAQRCTFKHLCPICDLPHPVYLHERYQLSMEGKQATRTLETGKRSADKQPSSSNTLPHRDAR